MPGYRHYFNMLERNYLRNCVVSLKDAKISMRIFIKDPVNIKGTDTRQSPKAMGCISLVLISNTLLDLHLNLELSAD